jgi:hypothetical protein
MEFLLIYVQARFPLRIQNLFTFVESDFSHFLGTIAKFLNFLNAFHYFPTNRNDNMVGEIYMMSVNFFALLSAIKAFIRCSS